MEAGDLFIQKNEWEDQYSGNESGGTGNSRKVSSVKLVVTFLCLCPMRMQPVLVFWLGLFLVALSTRADVCSGTHRYTSSAQTGSLGCDRYDANTAITWTISLLDSTQRILLEFDQFNTEARYDIVTIYDGHSTSDPLLGAYSGTLVPGPFRSTGNSILVSFTSDGAIQGSGFGAHWSAFQGVLSTTAFCSGTGSHTLEAPEGTFGCEGYANNADLSWRLVGSQKERLVLTFLQFNTEASQDTLTIYDGPDSSREPVARYSGSELPPPVHASGNELFLHFVSDYSLTRTGFTAQWESLVMAAGPCYNSTQKVLVDTEGFVGCESGYGNSVHTTWLIDLVGDYVIELQFLTFDLETAVDYVDVYDGSTESAPRLGAFTGQRIPSPLRSSGSQMLIVLRTNNDITMDGFTAEYNSAHVIQQLGCAADGAFVFTSPEDSVGCDGYASGVSESWVLVAQSDDESISLTWESFDTENGHDVISIYDGNSTLAQLVYSHSGSELPPPVVSSGRYLLIKFTADDNRVQGDGFSAVYENIVRQDDPTDCAYSHHNYLSNLADSFGCTGYSNNVEVTWKIHVPDGNVILIQFDSFFTEITDVLTIYDGPSDSSTKIGQFSGTLRPSHIASSSNYVYLVFQSDESITRQGFSVSYTSVFTGHQSGSCYSNQDLTLLESSGEFGCSGYGPNIHSTWTISTSVNTYINFEFGSFQTEEKNDLLTIYDGTGVNAPVLASLSGMQIPSHVQTSGNHAYVVFTSNENLQYNGFTVYYQSEEVAAAAIPYCGESSVQVLNQTSGQFGCNEYGNSLHSSWTIQLPRGYQITLEFLLVDTEMYYDVISLYNGANEQAPLIGNYSGAISPGAVTSRSNSLYAVFNSDSSVSAGYAGFRAEYSSFYHSDLGGDYCDRNYTYTFTSATHRFGCNGYTSNIHITWKIESFGNILVNFETFSTENNYDVLSVYDGLDANAPLLGTYSGNKPPSPITSTGTYLFLSFKSDANVNMAGFSAVYETLAIEE